MDSYDSAWGWLKTDTIPKYTLNDILKPDGVADQAFETVTPDPRWETEKPSHEVLFGFIELGVMAGVIITLFCLLPSKD
jgi:hypothetical protein